MIPFGKGFIARPGTDLSVVTFGALVYMCCAVADNIANDTGHQIEVIDLRSLLPYDWNLIRASVEKTSRAVVVHEDMVSWGYGSEIAARISHELFDYLDAPVARIGGKDCFVGYHPDLENATLPNESQIRMTFLESLQW